MKAVRIVGTPLASDGAAVWLPYHVDITIGTDTVQVFGQLAYGGRAFTSTVAAIPDDASAILVTPDVRLRLEVGNPD